MTSPAPHCRRRESVPESAGRTAARTTATGRLVANLRRRRLRARLERITVREYIAFWRVRWWR